MRLNRILPLAFALLLFPAGASATIVSGAAARSMFDDAVTNIGYTLQDFEGFTSDQKLTTNIPGLTFQTHKGATGLPFNAPVNVSTRSTTKTIVGTPCSVCSDDGRYAYRITFDTPQAAIGIDRKWSSNVITRWYDTTGALLGEVTGNGYQGYIVEATDPLAQWIGRIEMDGGTPGSPNVGYSDDLIYGTTLMPEPGLAALLTIALGGLALRRR